MDKKVGFYTAGKPRIGRRKIQALSEKGKGPAVNAQELSVSRMSIYRILRELEMEAKIS